MTANTDHRNPSKTGHDTEPHAAAGAEHPDQRTAQGEDTRASAAGGSGAGYGRESAQASDTPDAERQVADELSGMDDAVAAAEQELLQHRDAMLRMQAEMENLRKRLIRDQERSRKFALESIMKDLLEVRDSLERGLQAPLETSTVESLREGKELTLRMLNKVMTDHGLEIIDPQGQAFDPEWHEAMTLVPDPNVPENTVVDVLQKGFRLHERLIRPARVIVSSGG